MGFEFVSNRAKPCKRAPFGCFPSWLSAISEELVVGSQVAGQWGHSVNLNDSAGYLANWRETIHPRHRLESNRPANRIGVFAGLRRGGSLA